jgi:cytochrome c oxidase subunit 4
MDHETTDAEHASMAHITPVRLLVVVFVTLVALTILTVVANDWPLGNLDIWVALTIACIKATLVALFFMHMYWDKGFNVFAFLTSFVFVTLFIGFTLMDTRHYQPDIRAFPTSGRPDKDVKTPLESFYPYLFPSEASGDEQSADH